MTTAFDPRAATAINVNCFAAVVPNEMQPLSVQLGGHDAAALYVGVGGDVSLTGQDGKSAIFKNVPSGTLLQVHVVTLNAAGTTASNFVALYRV